MRKKVEVAIVLTATAILITCIGVAIYLAFQVWFNPDPAEGAGRRGLLHHNVTNATSHMLYGDDWNCGYIENWTTIEDIRDCFRD